MARKRRSKTEPQTTMEMENEPATPIISAFVEKDTTFKSLRERLAEINQQGGVTGYILRSSTSASVDLREPSDLMALALLSSHAVDTGHEFSETFNLGTIENILLEGKNAKVLCVALDQIIVNIFMEKSVDHNQILNKICGDLGE